MILITIPGSRKEFSFHHSVSGHGAYIAFSFIYFCYTSQHKSCASNIEIVSFQTSQDGGDSLSYPTRCRIGGRNDTGGMSGG